MAVPARQTSGLSAKGCWSNREAGRGLVGSPTTPEAGVPSQCLHVDPTICSRTWCVVVVERLDVDSREGQERTDGSGDDEAGDDASTCPPQPEQRADKNGNLPVAMQRKAQWNR